MSLGIGLLAVALCVSSLGTAVQVLFGSFALPTKAFRTGDGVFFQFCMCSGIFFVGVITHFIQCSLSSTHTCPAFIPLAASGGTLWTTANMMLVPIVDTIGIGLCMMIWGMLEMLAGWATGRFGLFGVAPEPLTHAWLNSLGVAIAVASLLIIFFVQPAVAEEPAPAPKWKMEDASTVHGTRRLQDEAGAKAYEPLIEDAVSQKQGSIQQGPNTQAAAGSDAADAKWTDALTPWQKHAFGVVACIIAGTLSGSTFTPLLFIVDKTQAYIGPASGAPFPGASSQLLDHLHAHFTGIWLTSTCYTIAYAILRRNRPQIFPEIVFPAFVSGVVWGVAMVCWFIANAELEVVISFPMVTMGPGLVNLLYGCVLFGEVRGKRNFLLLGASIAVYLAASVCVVFSKE